MKPKAFITIGPEDSGNRMMHNILIQAGCAGKKGYKIPFDQKFDYALPEPKRHIAWLRSVPHNGSMPDLSLMIRDVAMVGYKPVVLVMTRAWWVTRKAATKNHTGNQEVTDKQLHDAYLHIFWHLLEAEEILSEPVEYYVVPYGELVREPRALGAVMRMLQLPEVQFEFKNANDKWYGWSDDPV